MSTYLSPRVARFDWLSLLQFLTDGMLVREMMKDPLLKEYRLSCDFYNLKILVI